MYPSQNASEQRACSVTLGIYDSALNGLSQLDNMLINAVSQSHNFPNFSYKTMALSSGDVQLAESTGQFGARAEYANVSMSLIGTGE